ncbi:MAG TPA: hypothetical protein PKC18_19210, partial [Lacipirellulaceae bacterium]|nr:hypothetical protein [Lacipirellulaceae bacterium]
YWNSGAFAATTPQVDARMHTTIRGVSAPWLIRRAATRRVQASRGSAQTEGARLVERSVAESMAPRLDEVVAKLNDRSRNFLNFLARTGNSAVRWQTMLRPTSVQIGYLPPSPSGLGAPVHAPPPLGADEAIGLSFHDSAIEGILRPQVAGAVWRDANFAMLQRELTGGNSEEFLIGLDPQRWSVQWSWRHPVRIHFTDEFAVVRFRFERVEIDGVEYQAPLEVRAEVEVGATPQGHEMRTRGQATVRGLDPEQPLPPHYQALLERKFQSMFSPKFYLDGLQFPAGGALDGLSGFNASGAILERGWVHLRYASRDAAPTMVVHQSE